MGDLISTGRFGEMMIGRGEALKWTRLDGQSTLKKSTSGDGEDEKEKRAYADDMRSRFGRRVNGDRLASPGPIVDTVFVTSRSETVISVDSSVKRTQL